MTDQPYAQLPLFKQVDAILVKVPSIEAGLDFYCGRLGQKLSWKKEDMAGVHVGQSELVLTTKLNPEVDMLVESVPEAVQAFVEAGGSIILEPEDIPVGVVAVVKDPFGNQLTLVDLSKGLYQTDEQGNVTGVA